MVGEHIRTLKGGRWNHAIDCGDETVIHLAEDGSAPALVRRSYRPEFVAGAEAVEVVTHRERTFPASEVVARAYSRISDPGLAATFRDSAAFAEWCVTGRISTAAPGLAGPPADAPVAAPLTAAPPRPPRAARAKGTGVRAKPVARGEAKPARKAATEARPRRAGRGRKAPAPAKPKGRVRKVARKVRRRGARG